MPGAHKEVREASWKENLRAQNLVDEGDRKTLLFALVPLTFSHCGSFKVAQCVWRGAGHKGAELAEGRGLHLLSY